MATKFAAWTRACTGFIVILTVGLALSACQPTRRRTPPPANTSPTFETSLSFGDSMQFDFAPQAPQLRSVRVAVAERPPQRPVSGEAVLDKTAVTRFMKTVENGRVNAQALPDRAEVTFRFAPAGESDVCGSGIEIGTFVLTLNEAGDDFSIEPDALALSQEVIDLIVDGVLEVCGEVSANFTGTLTIQRLNLVLQLVEMPANENVNENAPPANENAPPQNDNAPPAFDCNLNDIADAIDLSSGTSQDCNGNRIPDECDITAGREPDCNGNDIPDACDIVAGTSTDCNNNFAPDECELAAGTATDCDNNGRIDSCDPDCDGDGIPDACELSDGGIDCNGNDVPDDCDIASGAAEDCNENGVPDSCEPDGDGDGVINECDNCPNVFNPNQTDSNNNGVGNACEPPPPPPPDSDSDGVPDSGDNCPTVANPGQGDADGDGVGDACDTSIRYVMAGADGANDGTSWANAFVDLQDALAAAAQAGGGINQLWVAQGTYRPITVTTDPTATFQLLNGVGLFGGFGGTEVDFSERNVAANPTILSGDQLGNDPTGGLFDNSFHVVTASGVDGTAVLDGFVVTAGNAQGLGLVGFINTDRGAGVLAIGGSPTVANCRIDNNQAFYGGGGAYFGNGSSPRIRNCTFTNNSAFSQDGNAGGGGIYCEFSSNAIIGNCVFANNFAQVCGGGILYRESSIGQLVNCLVMDNSAGGGGGICVARTNDPINPMPIRDCTLAFNTTNGPFGGGGIYLFLADVTLSNSILWQNAATPGPQIALNTCPASITVTYSDVQGGANAVFQNPGGGCTVTFGGGNIDLDPLLNADGTLMSGSPCIDAGSNPAVPADVLDLDRDGNTTEPTPIDLAGGPRFVNAPTPDTGVGPAPIVDMGADEFQP